MIKFSREKVLLLHKLISEETGGDPNLRDIGLLDSALESAYQTFGGEDLYPSKEEKAARIGYSLISNHAFVDGNKRIGAHAMLMTLALNQIAISYTQTELVRIITDVASGGSSYNDLVAWLNEHLD